ncbi:MAG TPA: energy transducer TonB [Candidatus Polarisedimenticolia bacterium]|nr:energy transducer TonB [Candidatus Polarisedimenticolia bacterium]
MRSGPLLLSLALLSLLAVTVRAQEAGDKVVSIGQAADHAVQQSKLTLTGGAAFHLKSHIANAGSAKPEYSADVEEYWVSPEKWRRTVQSAGFFQTLIVNGGKISEKLTGDYYPFWLHDLVTALFEPLPMVDQLRAMRGELEIPEDSAKSNSCLNMQFKVGVAPAQNSLTYAFCFGGKGGLLQAVLTPGYKAQFADYQPFKKKTVARTIRAEFAPGLSLTAKVTELAELSSVDEKLFAIETATPAVEQMKTSQVGEDSARALALNTPPIVWPAVREGKTAGVMSVYVSIDRSGQVREVWPLAPSNPELSEAVREQVLQWKYKPYSNGCPSQMEAVLTFPFSTRIENPIPVLNDVEARKLATHVVEAVVPAGKARKGSKFSLRVSVDEAGKVQAVLNQNNIAATLYNAGAAALKQWRFRPYINQGAPDRFYADITFVVR